MFKKIVLKNAVLAVLMTVGIAAFEASASEGETGRCNDNFAFDTLAPIMVTPALLEELRVMSGAAYVRHEQDGYVYTADHRHDRLKVTSDIDNRFSHFKCG
ncbi:hypothetical protein [Pseudomonas sp. A34-9]|uniref:hypothetical protein n=1 Tax=Pseudomonas sp. A34-9 TaxID=3034675 RepID=UPI00240D4204|nr:hypothetical protein [Pseudomonas sp. A34-9]